MTARKEVKVKQESLNLKQLKRQFKKIYSSIYRVKYNALEIRKMAFNRFVSKLISDGILPSNTEYTSHYPEFVTGKR